MEQSLQERVLLLVDDEPNILRALTRLLRRDGYQILTANGGHEGLEILAQHTVGVIISDQRMPEMSGTEFLSRVKERYPDTLRIALSGYTDLNSVTDAINQGAIYKFLTKPWEDELLRGTVREAFAHFEAGREETRPAVASSAEKTAATVAAVQAMPSGDLFSQLLLPAMLIESGRVQCNSSLLALLELIAQPEMAALPADLGALVKRTDAPDLDVVGLGEWRGHQAVVTSLRERESTHLLLLLPNDVLAGTAG